MDLVHRLKSIKPRGKKILFVCVGTDRSTGDSLGPIVGTLLKFYGYNVLGTIDKPVHAQNITETISHIERYYNDHFVVATDAALGEFSRVGSITADKGPLLPGAGVDKKLPAIGDARIVGVVNVGGFMEYFVLQNTRLSSVMRMADEIVEVIKKVVRPPRRPRKVSALFEVAAAMEKRSTINH